MVFWWGSYIFTSLSSPHLLLYSHHFWSVYRLKLLFSHSVLELLFELSFSLKPLQTDQKVTNFEGILHSNWRRRQQKSSCEKLFLYHHKYFSEWNTDMNLNSIEEEGWLSFRMIQFFFYFKSAAFVGQSFFRGIFVHLLTWIPMNDEDKCRCDEPFFHRPKYFSKWQRHEITHNRGQGMAIADGKRIFKNPCIVFVLCGFWKSDLSL